MGFKHKTENGTGIITDPASSINYEGIGKSLVKVIFDFIKPQSMLEMYEVDFLKFKALYNARDFIL